MTEPAEPLIRVDGDRRAPGRPRVRLCRHRGQVGVGRQRCQLRPLTSGDKGSHDPDLRPGGLAARRESEQRSPAAELGVIELSSCAIPTASWKTRWSCAAS